LRIFNFLIRAFGTKDWNLWISYSYEMSYHIGLSQENKHEVHPHVLFSYVFGFLCSSYVPSKRFIHNFPVSYKISIVWTSQSCVFPISMSWESLCSKEVQDVGGCILFFLCTIHTLHFNFPISGFL
jgi:hypothetical protein